jgi:hypothetical protein
MLVIRVLVAIAVLSFVVSAWSSGAALVMYLRQEGATLVGFGFHRYYYGDMRRSHPRIFVGSFGGAVLGLVLLVLAGVVRAFAGG